MIEFPDILINKNAVIEGCKKVSENYVTFEIAFFRPPIGESFEAFDTTDALKEKKPIAKFATPTELVNKTNVVILKKGILRIEKQTK